MNRLRWVVILLAPLAAVAADDYTHWTAKDFKDFRKTLAPKINEKKVASQQLADYGNHVAMVAHREGSGDAEQHATMVDLFVIEIGEAKLILGGTIVDAKTISLGERRGATIKGGKTEDLAVGDIVRIPAGMPHQLIVAPGKQVTYFTLKVKQ